MLHYAPQQGSRDNMAPTKEDTTSREDKAYILEHLILAPTMTSKLDKSNWSHREKKAFDVLAQGTRQMIRDKSGNTAASSRNRNLAAADLVWAHRDFEFDLNMFNHKYVGDGTCLLESSQSICDHEFCRDALTNGGISYLEFDTIDYYQQRISTAKGSRMKDALRKQRACQLLKDKEYWEKVRKKLQEKMKAIGTEAGQSLLGAVYGGDRLSFGTNPDSLQRNAVVLVGRMLSSLRVANLSIVKSQFGAWLTRRIMDNTKPTRYDWWDPANCLEYFGPLDVRHIDAAVMNVREMLHLYATIYYEVDYCLLAFLEQFKELSKYIHKSTLTSSGVTVTQALHYIRNIVRSDAESKDRKQASKVPRGDIYNVLFESSLMELEVKKSLVRTIEQCMRSGTYPNGEFERIKENALASSPLPSVLELSLEPGVRISKFDCTLRILMERRKTKSRSHMVQEAAQQIRVLAEHLPSKFRSVLEELRRTLCLLTQSPPNIPISETEKDSLRDILNDTEVVLLPEVEKYLEDDAMLKDQAEKAAQFHNSSETILSSMCLYLSFPGMLDTDCREFSIAYSRDLMQHQSGAHNKSYRELWIETIKHNIWRGIGEAFCVYLRFNPSTWVCALDGYLDELLGASSSSESISLDEGCDLLQYLTIKYQHGWCAPAATVRLLFLLSQTSAWNPAHAKQIIKQLEYLATISITSLPVQWQAILRPLSTAILNLYGVLTIECMHTFGRADIEQVVLTLLFLVTAYVVCANSKSQANAGLDFMMAFTKLILGSKNQSLHVNWEGVVRRNFDPILEQDELRCSDPEVCMTHSDFEADSLIEPEVKNSAKTKTKRNPRTKLQVEHRKLVNVKYRFREQDEKLMRVIHKGPSLLEAADALKYIAHRVKFLQEMDADTIAVDLLSYAFQKVEQVLGETPAQPSTEISSLVIGMHNQCNVWELSESREKTWCFFNACKVGLRGARDIEHLIKSMHKWAVLSYSPTRRNAFSKLAKLLIKQAGPHFPCDGLDRKLAVEANLHIARAETQPLATKCRVSRLDYILSRYPLYEKPTISFLVELFRDNTDHHFFEYCECLLQELIHTDKESAAQRLEASIQNLEQMKWDGVFVSSKDPHLQVIALVAMDSWERNEHEDVTYYDWDHTETIPDICLGSGGGSSCGSLDDTSSNEDEDVQRNSPCNAATQGEDSR